LRTLDNIGTLTNEYSKIVHHNYIILDKASDGETPVTACN